MENKNEKSMVLMNHLVEINNDRIDGYTRAIKETDQEDLKSLFSQFVTHSNTCKQELSSEVTKLGGEPKTGTSTSGKVYRAWMDVKAALTKRDRKAILNSCEFGEDVAVQAYKDVLGNQDLANDHRLIVTNQFEIIKDDHDKIKHLRDTLQTA